MRLNLEETLEAALWFWVVVGTAAYLYQFKGILNPILSIIGLG